jgi:hypothetical protein
LPELTGDGLLLPNEFDARCFDRTAKRIDRVISGDDARSERYVTALERAERGVKRLTDESAQPDNVDARAV